jgi:uncharacterized protein YndB with AHSA1/START domain
VTETAAIYLSDGVELTRRIEAPPETVYLYFTEPERFRAWLGTDAELDPQPGGEYRIRLTNNSGVSACGRYVELDPPRRVVFTWGFEGLEGLPPGASTVEVTLTRDDDATVVRLVHRGLDGRELCDFHVWGWDIGLDRLVIAGVGGDPGPYPHADY